jgi:hypothetical protein
MTLNGKSPAMLYYGAEYCPYCAAERWAMTAALSRFGTWSNLKITASSHTDVDPETHTFSYYGATFTSPYIAFAGIERYSNIPPLDLLPPAEPHQAGGEHHHQVHQLKYIPGASTRGGSGSRSSTSTTGPSSRAPATTQASWPTSRGARSPAGSAMPAIRPPRPSWPPPTTSQRSSAPAPRTQPASVCTSPGVQAAAKALKLS